MPADVSVMHDEHLKGLFEKYWQTPQLGALERMKLYKLTWDLIGSGIRRPAPAVREVLRRRLVHRAATTASAKHRGRPSTSWSDDLMASYDIPAPTARRKVA